MTELPDFCSGCGFLKPILGTHREGKKTIKLCRDCVKLKTDADSALASIVLGEKQSEETIRAREDTKFVNRALAEKMTLAAFFIGELVLFFASLMTFVLFLKGHP